MAAAYAFGIAKNHPFVDGNKRVGLVLMELFLNLNGYDLWASDEDTARTIMALTAGDLSDDDFMIWVSKHARHAHPRNPS